MSVIAKKLEPALTEAAAEASAIRSRMKDTWEDGNYAGFATYMEPGAIDILNGWHIPPGSRLLDVGCGSGQTAIPAARQGMRVTGIDIASNLIEHSRKRAALEGIDARFDVGDAESLPYGDNEFDAVISLIGAMFAPDYNRVAQELARVCRQRGRLHMANWTPESFAATMFRCIASYTPPPDGVSSPTLWGIEDTVVERLCIYFSDFELERRYYPQWKYPFDTKTLVEFFRQNFGPVKRAFDSLDAPGQRSLRTELEDIYEAHNIATDGTTEIQGQYLNVSARRR